MAMNVAELSMWAVGTTVMKDVLSETVSVTGTISDMPVGWITGFGCLVCETESCVVVSVTSGAGTPRESFVISVTGEGYTGFVVNSPGMSIVSTDTSICGEKMVIHPSGSEEVVLVVSCCRTLSSVYHVSATSGMRRPSIGYLPLKGAPSTPRLAIANNTTLNISILL
jgi:hypothetical protein